MNNGFGSVGAFEVRTTNERGFTVEEIAEDLLSKLLFISSEAHPAIREQAIAFKDRIRPALIHYMKRAVIEDRATMAVQLSKQGHEELAQLIRRL